YDFCAHLQRRAPKGSALERYLSLQRKADVVMPLIVGEQPNEDLVDVGDACGDVMKAIAPEAGVVLESGFSGPVFQHSHGRSVYFPCDSAGVSAYENSAFASETGWGKFLSALVKRTQV
ncbi:MAG: hypothetical protein L0191_01050, partial [Acidobacteria bacterium]|nr:hypothetical protein [Acidobacteriota bacterium]